MAKRGRGPKKPAKQGRKSRKMAEGFKGKKAPRKVAQKRNRGGRKR